MAFHYLPTGVVCTVHLSFPYVFDFALSIFPALMMMPGRAGSDRAAEMIYVCTVPTMHLLLYRNGKIR